MTFVEARPGEGFESLYRRFIPEHERRRDAIRKAKRRAGRQARD